MLNIFKSMFFSFKSSALKPLILVSVTLCGMITGSAIAAETKDWNRSNETNKNIISHQPWQQILDRYLETNTPSKVNLFRYGSVSKTDRATLESYLKMLQKTDPRNYSKAEQESYWINLYNALTVELILKNYPVKSITKLGESIFAFGPWDDNATTVAGHKLSLNDIEHKILRPIWKDPRIHYAVNCASFSCPNLSSKAFTSANTNELLENGAHAYVNHPRGVTLKKDDLLLSSIYDWYIDDFGGNNKSLLKHLKHYAEPTLKKQLEQFEKANSGDIDHDYDWSLNKPSTSSPK